MKNRIRDWVIRMKNGEEVFLIKRIDGRKVETMVFNNKAFMWRSYDDNEKMIKEASFTEEEVSEVLKEYVL